MQEKLTQHCKSTILQKKKEKEKLHLCQYITFGGDSRTVQIKKKEAQTLRLKV